ncbi:Zinc/iron permease [Phycomyces nitens]|nr:Zinc/iron permease [Phycomyces nitens]
MPLAKSSCLLALLFFALFNIAQAQSQLTCNSLPTETYNLPLRIGSIFLILVTSGLGVFTPIILFRVLPYKAGGFREHFLNIGKFFGTGVISGTAFIHMLPEAFGHFSSPCLSSGWKTYPGYAGVFCMVASFGLQLIELFAISNMEAMAKRRALAAQTEEESAGVEVTDSKIVPANTKGDLSPHEHSHDGFSTEGHVHSAGFLENDEKMMRNMGTFILELGILVHSIIIGITVGTTGNHGFITLLIALVFHQFFEGVALGTRINELEFKGWIKPTIMGAFFLIITPFGMAIGVGVHSAFPANSSSFILAQAILDSLSAGILLYSAFISLMSLEINQNVAFRRSSTMNKIISFTSMYAGAALMSVLGTWI